MKSPRKTKNSNSTTSNLKPGKEDKEKEQQKKQQVDSKIQEKEAQFQKLEEYVNESGLSLAFNIIFAELISKQILPENFFTYTSMRLKQIGKEIEGLKTKEEIKVEKSEEEKKEEQKPENNEEADNKINEPQENKDDNEKKEDDNVLLTVQQEKKKSIKKK